VKMPDEGGNPSELSPGNWLGAEVTTIVGGDTSVTHRTRDSAWDDFLLDIIARYPDSLSGPTTNLVLAELCVLAIPLPLLPILPPLPPGILSMAAASSSSSSSSSPSSFGRLKGMYLVGEEALDATGAKSSSLTLETLCAEAGLPSLSRLEAV
jgi:hypothetical protein